MDNRLNKYFIKYLDDYYFLELMPDYIKRERLDFMRNVPLPVKKEYVAALTDDNQGLEFKHFTLGMINVIGIDPTFKYVPQYMNFLNYVNKNIISAIIMVGIEQAENEELEQACISLRAALQMDPQNPDALYNYMLVCYNLYNKSDNNEYTADFKIEVFETLQALKKISPEFSMTYYYLGFAYLNAGKYKLAQQEWQTFIKLSVAGNEQDEIEERLKEIEDPVIIENGYTDIMDGNWDKGLETLEKYKDSPLIKEWWPLPYYLGVGYSRTGKYEEALKMLQISLKENPSSSEIMAELIIVNNALGDEVNAEKYKKKLEIMSQRSNDDDS